MTKNNLIDCVIEATKGTKKDAELAVDLVIHSITEALVKSEKVELRASLSVVHGIVKQSNGHVQVYSEPNVGTTFKIYLPAVEGQVTARKALDSGTTTDGTETILLVEDERAVRGLALGVFQSHGYEVLTATDGKDALRIAEQCRRPIDLLVTDVVMPCMGGRELAKPCDPRSRR